MKNITEMKIKWEAWKLKIFYQNDGRQHNNKEKQRRLRNLRTISGGPTSK